nr:ribonucleases P/MRP protein subunit POP1-like isoform X2 [Ipomoea batatas]
MCLITNGAHAIGLREKQWIACEAELPYFPSDFPDCNSYSCFMKMEAAAADEKVERNPPSMRPFGVPILPPWNSVHLALDKRSFVERNYQVQCKDFSTKERTKNSLVDYSDCRTCSPDADDHCHIPFVGFIARTSYILSQFLDKINGSHLLLFPKFPNRKECVSNFIKDEKMVNEHSDKLSGPFFGMKRPLENPAQGTSNPESFGIHWSESLSTSSSDHLAHVLVSLTSPFTSAAAASIPSIFNKASVSSFSSASCISAPSSNSSRTPSLSITFSETSLISLIFDNGSDQPVQPPSSILLEDSSFTARCLCSSSFSNHVDQPSAPSSPTLAPLLLQKCSKSLCLLFLLRSKEGENKLYSISA